MTTMLVKPPMPQSMETQRSADAYSPEQPADAWNAALEGLPVTFETRNLRLYYGNTCALDNINITIPRRKITAFIGPSGCGKSSLLRCLNRMNDLIDHARIEGEVLLDGQSIYDKAVDVPELRRRVGMDVVFMTSGRVVRHGA